MGKYSHKISVGNGLEMEIYSCKVGIGNSIDSKKEDACLEKEIKNVLNKYSTDLAQYLMVCLKVYHIRVAEMTEREETKKE